MNLKSNAIVNKSYVTKEMDSRKFLPLVPKKEIEQKLYNRANIKYNGYTCRECVNADECPNEIRAYHNLEASISGRWSAPCWCMGTCGYNDFEPNWDVLLYTDYEKE